VVGRKGKRENREREKRREMTQEMIYIYSGESKRLDLWLTEKLSDCTRSYVQKLIEKGNVLVNNSIVKAGIKLSEGDEVKVDIPLPEELQVVPQDIPLDIVYEDEDILIVNKTKDMVVHPAPGNPDGTLVNAVMFHCRDSLSDINGIIRPGIVHRIDKDTTGLLCVAKNNNAHLDLAEQLKEHSMKRTYVALVEKVINEERGTVNAPIGRHPQDRKKMAVNLKNGREAVTHFKVLERFSKYTLIKLSLETGRTHQIRVHMAYIGHPVCGDDLYGRKFPLCETNGQVLHAQQLELKHPRTDKNQVFKCETPDYMNKILDLLREKN